MLDLMTLVLSEDTVPKDEDVVAGPWGAFMFVVLIGATVFLIFSFLKQLRKAKAAKEQGLYGDEPVAQDTDAETDPETDAEPEGAQSGEPAEDS